MRTSPATLLATTLALGGWPPAAFAAGAGPSFTGQATDPATGRVLYTESHEVAPDGTRESVTYTGADGARLGTETFDYGGMPYVPIYRLTMAADGYTEALVRRSPDGRTVTLEKQSTRDGEPQTATVEAGAPDAGPLVAAAGAQRMIGDHLSELAAGTVVKFRLAVPGRLDSYRLRVRKVADARDGVALVVQPDSWLRLLTPDLHMVFDLRHRRLVRYEGISPVQDPATRKAFPAVRLVYSYPAGD